MKTPPQTPGMTSSMDVYAVYRNALGIDVRCLAGMINERFGVNFPDDSVTQKVERLKAENKLQDPSHKWNYNAVGKFIWNHGVDEEELSLLIALGDEDRDYIKGVRHHRYPFLSSKLMSYS